MLTCDGYKMFYGTVRVTPVVQADGTRWKEPFDLTGTWLWKPFDDPDIKGMWYCKPEDGGMTKSWPSDILSNFREQCMIM